MTQPPLDDIDWTDLCHLGAEHLAAAALEPRDLDLRGQGLTAVQLHTIQDVTLTGRYL
ncbi:hypothetical protein ABT119_06205 [Streptomyces sp. NPDC001910]|uniref:hypothetical protein n=1 Tax=Streptomyces sp. NPDC001910 TaxID=3154403 RepID=UPI00331EA27A